MADVVVEAEQLSLVHEDGGGVHGLDLVVPRGTIVGLIGPSGSGKSTTVRMLLGLRRPGGGRVRVLGVDPASMGTADRGRIGYLPQDSLLWPELSLRHNLHLVASLYGLPLRARWWPGAGSRRARERVREVLELVGLASVARRRLAQASGGEQRRLALACALVHDPELLVLDEPTAGLDPVLRRELWAHFGALRDEGRTLLVTTQHIDEAAHCDVVVVLVDGRAAATGSPAQLREQAFGTGGDADARTLDDVFVELVQRHRRGRADDGATTGVDAVDLAGTSQEVPA